MDNDYPRDLVNKDGKVQEFKRKEDVPAGWFLRDTGEEVNPATAAVEAPKKKGKTLEQKLEEAARQPVSLNPEEPKAE